MTKTGTNGTAVRETKDIVNNVKVPSLKEQALEIKETLNNGKNSVTINTSSKKVHYDLDGADHKGTSTPHIQYSYPNINPKTGQTFYNKDRGPATPMTQKDIRAIRKFLEKFN